MRASDTLATSSHGWSQAKLRLDFWLRFSASVALMSVSALNGKSSVSDFLLNERSNGSSVWHTFSDLLMNGLSFDLGSVFGVNGKSGGFM